MNITSINAYNNTTFGAKKQTRKPIGKYASKQKLITPAKVAGAAGVTGAIALAILVPSCNAKKDVKPQETMPTIAIVETQETIETIPQETQAVKNTDSQWLPISVKPVEQRRIEKEIEIKPGDRLVDIVIKYAQPTDTQYESLIPYIERLRVENPYLIKKVDRFSNDGKDLQLPEYTLIYNPQQVNYLKVDSIFPENIIEPVPIEPIDVIEETQPLEIEPTEPIQVTSPEDTVVINDNVFTFDLGTLHKPFLGDHEGLMFGKFTTLDKKGNGNVELTRHEGSDSKSNISQVLTYDKDGKIIEMADYNNGKATTISAYTYKTDSTVETVIDKTAKGKQIDTVTSVYDRTEDVIYSKDFIANKNSIVTFDFVSGTAKIGETTWNFDEFYYNEDAIGSKQYVGFIEGNEIRFDILENGFNVEYITNGEIEARDQFDLEGNLILSE